MARKYVDAMSYSTNIHKTSKATSAVEVPSSCDADGRWRRKKEQEQGVQLVYCQKLVLLLVLLSSARTKRGCRQRVTLYRRRQEAHRQVDDAVATAIAAAPHLLVLPPVTYTVSTACQSCPALASLEFMLLFVVLSITCLSFTVCPAAAHLPNCERPAAIIGYRWRWRTCSSQHSIA